MANPPELISVLSPTNGFFDARNKHIIYSSDAIKLCGNLETRYQTLPKPCNSKSLFCKLSFPIALSFPILASTNLSQKKKNLKKKANVFFIIYCVKYC